ncbi:hypothetical protein M9458_031049, partial [Cirrhinus mrigala]
IFLWEQNLEQFHMDLFRFRCYLFPTPNACWLSPPVPPNWPWADWAFFQSLPSMHW